MAECDLETRLREDGDDWAEGHPSKALAYEAADRIVELERTLEAMDRILARQADRIRELEAEVARLNEGVEKERQRAARNYAAFRNALNTIDEGTPP